MKTLALLAFTALSFILQAQWKSLKGPYYGYVNDYKNEGNSTYISTSNGLYRSDDEGKSWKRLDNGLPKFHYSLDFCVNKNEVFLSYHDYSTGEVGFVYSSDSGDSWTTRPLLNLDWFPYIFAYSNGIILAKSSSGLIESLNKGITWKSSNFGKGVDYINDIYSNNSYFFVLEGPFSGPNNLHRRPIHDTTWQVVLNTERGPSNLHVTDSVLIFVNYLKPGLRSDDNGIIWTPILIQSEYGGGLIADFGDSLYFSDLKYISKSTNKGLDWKIHKNTLGTGFYLYDVIRAGSKLLGNQYGYGLIRTGDEFENHESSRTGIYDCDANRIIASDSFLFVLTSNTFERYDIINKIWTDSSAYFDEGVRELYYLNHILYLATSSGSFYTSRDFGQTFSKIDAGFYIGNGIIGNKYKLVIKDGGGFHASNDFGKTWYDYVNTDPSIKYYRVYDIGILNQEFIIAVQDSSTNKILCYTSDSLKNWKLLPVNFPYINNHIELQNILTVNNRLFFRLSYGGPNALFVYEPTTHNLIPCKGLDNIIGSRTKLIEYKGSLLLLIDDMLFKSSDGGINWVPVINELRGYFINILTDLAIKDSTLFASCRSFGVVETDWDNLLIGDVKGIAFYDGNNDDTYNGNDVPLKNAFIQIKRARQNIPTDENGKFSFNYASGIPDTLAPNFYSKQGHFNPTYQLFKPGDTSLQFAFKLDSKTEDVTVQMYQLTRARPGFKYYLELIVSNQGSQICSGDLQMHFDKIFNYVTATVVPDQINNGTLIWKITDLKSFETRQIQIEFTLPASVPINTAFEQKLIFINLTINDTDLKDNESIIEDKVHGSFDPNEMTVDKPVLSKLQLQNKTPLNFTIRFQNTGNDEAEFVRLINYLGNFDLNTFKVNASSHPYTYHFTEDGYLEIYFDMIHLPDSMSNESKSHGYFSYSIIPIPERVNGNLISIYTIIYFDYNTGIQTNDAVTLIQDVIDTNNPGSKLNVNLMVVPNPNTGYFQLYGAYLENRKSEAVRINNLQGHCVFELKDNLYPGYKLNLEKLNSGLYFLKIGNSKQLVCKLLIQK